MDKLHFHLARFLFDEDPAPAGEPEPEEAPEEPTGDDQAKTDKADKGKSFSQKDLDELVKDRLAKEKAKHKRELEAVQSLNSGTEAELEQYRKLFQAQLDERLQTLDESTRSLVKKLDMADQLEWLAENPTTKAKTPDTPPGGRRREDKQTGPDRPRLRTGI